jgi:hypothetical protein
MLLLHDAPPGSEVLKEGRAGGSHLDTTIIEDNSRAEATIIRGHELNASEIHSVVLLCWLGVLKGGGGGALQFFGTFMKKML